MREVVVAPPPKNVRRLIYEYVDRLRYILAKIDPKDTVDKLNKSKLMGNVNVNKMVLPLVSCWWCSLFVPALSTNKSLRFLRQCMTVSSTTVVVVAIVAARRPGGSGGGGGGGGGRQFIGESGRQ